MSEIPRTLEPEVMDTSQEAVDYDSMNHSTVNKIFVQDLMSFCAQTEFSRPSACLLDLGTGTAQIPLTLLAESQDFGPVLACDLSVEMLKLANRHLTLNDVSEFILPMFCDAKRLPVAGESCDIVMSNSIVHHIPAPIDVLGESLRVLRPGGVLFIRDLMRPSTADEVERLVSIYAGDENSHQQQLFRQSLHAALTVDEIRQLLSMAGMSPDWATATSDRHWTIAGRRSQ